MQKTAMSFHSNNLSAFEGLYQSVVEAQRVTMQSIQVVVDSSLQASDWCSRDFDSVDDALDELMLCLEDASGELRLSFELPLLFESSLPRLWQQVARCLQTYNGHVVVGVPSVRMASHFERYLPVLLRVKRDYERASMRLSVTVGDISQAKADVIVNASNRRLELGGGVSHALRVRFGDDLQHQMWSRCRAIDDGELIVTTHDEQTGVKCIYHVASAKGDPLTIERALFNVWRQAQRQGHRNIISPLLGTGTGGLSKRAFASIVYKQALRSAYDGVFQLWCWTRTDFDEVCAVLDEKLSR